MVSLAESVLPLGRESEKPLNVSLSRQLVKLLSEQLYQSPIKAIEELVVNAFDAEAKECRVFVPEPSAQTKRFVVVYDNGTGMDQGGLENLWHIGHSTKREERDKRRATRKQIGKFGIGKLATYTIANRLTYITRTKDQILLVTLNFNDLVDDPTGTGSLVVLPVIYLDDRETLEKNDLFTQACAAAHIDTNFLFKADEKPQSVSWTIAILEELKPKAEKIGLGRLRWVLSTAMPLRSDFHLFLNGAEVESAKESYQKAVDFDVIDLPQKRLDELYTSTGEQWKVEGNQLVSKNFPDGVSGRAIVTIRSLLAGKSADITRSHGFFIRVRERLVNEADELFGISAKSFETFYRFRADLQADDLDTVLTAPREGVEESRLQMAFQELLAVIFNEARARYQDYLKNCGEKEKRKNEDQRNYVQPQLVEYPVADILATQDVSGAGAEADESWFYLDVDSKTDYKNLIESLYNENRKLYNFEYRKRGALSRFVRFNPRTSTFDINLDHDLVVAHDDGGKAHTLLQDVAVAEALLEVYLRESHVSPHVIGEVLERRDMLLRSLAKDRPFSLAAISRSLLDAVADERDLEMAVVFAARALGFVASHISGDDEPDGIARFVDYPGGEKTIILETKATGNIPTLNHLDFAGLRQHAIDNDAQGCLLVARAYPGSTRGEESQASRRAREQGISCWTVEQLAHFVAHAESNHLTARHVLDIVLNAFSPDQVSAALNELFHKSAWNRRELYRAALTALRRLEGKFKTKPRSVDMVATEVVGMPEFSDAEFEDIESAIKDLVSASQGGLTLRDNIIIMHGSYDDIERRLEGLTKQNGAAMKASSFYHNECS